MGTFMDAGGVQRLEAYFRRIGDILEEESRRASFAIYAMGLLGDGESKSIEPIAARACPDPTKVDAMHQRLLHFAVDSRWSDREVRQEAARYALGAMTAYSGEVEHPFRAKWNTRSGHVEQSERQRRWPGFTSPPSWTGSNSFPGRAPSRP